MSAQTSTGQIAGTVFDQSGAVIPGAAIQITNAETGESVRRVESNEVGRFSAPLLRPGTYTVVTELEGFKQYVQSAVQLRVDEVINLRLVLEPGTVTEQVTVEAMAIQAGRDDAQYWAGCRRDDHSEAAAERPQLSGPWQSHRRNRPKQPLTRQDIFGLRQSRLPERLLAGRRAQRELSAWARQPAARRHAAVTGSG